MVSGPAAPAAAGPAPTVVARSITLPPPSADQLHQISQSTRPQAQSPRDAESPAGARSAEDSGGVPVIDLQSTPSGEFEVDVEPDDDAEDAAQAAAPAEAQRARTPSTPPPAGSTTGQLLAAAPAQPAAAVAPGTPSGQHAVVAPAAGGSAPAAGKDPHHAHPPPPPPAALHHQAKPPAPPQPAKKESAAKPASSSSTPAASRTMTDRLRAKPWFVDVFDEDYLRTLPFLTPQATQAEAEFVANAMSLTPGQQVLDVGCGYGRHAMELAARGFHVVGLDLSAPLLLRGGEEAQRRSLQINFVRGDMRELEFESQFDGAYCLFSTFGYFDDETNKRTVANIARALKPGGRVLLEILNRDYVIADLPTRVWWEGDGCVVLEEVELNYFSSRIQVNRSVVFDDGRQVEQEISIRAYALHEVGKLMHAAGFRVLEVSGGYQTRGRFFGNQSRHIIVLAERKDPTAP
jgi:SAM-dependent methyltransferase